LYPGHFRLFASNRVTGSHRDHSPERLLGLPIEHRGAEILNLDRRRRDQRRITPYSSEEVDVYRYVDRRRL